MSGLNAFRDPRSTVITCHLKNRKVSQNSELLPNIRQYTCPYQNFIIKRCLSGSNSVCKILQKSGTMPLQIKR